MRFDICSWPISEDHEEKGRRPRRGPAFNILNRNNLKRGWVEAESIELFIEDQAFSLLYPALRPLSRQKVVSLSRSLVCRWSSLLTGEGAGEGAREFNARKPGPL